MRISGRIKRFSTFTASAKGGERTGWPLLVLLAAMCVSGCMHWPDINEDCESYGVTESRMPMGRMVHLIPLQRADLDEICIDAQSAAADSHPLNVINGCTIPMRDGRVLAYYRDGDRCAMNHELCHAKHGVEHTVRYLDELAAGVPMPYCPNNQLAGLKTR
ncbi:MAG: hypothetical protein RQ826_09270 [Xanthomonadales bacterium]|nr:hypothetical protein [Xanthomonadales bacterium]